MTVPQNPNIRTEAVGNGVTVVFPFDFLCLEARDIQVSVSGVVLPSSQYSVSGLGQQQGGTVTFVNAPDDGAAILIELAVVAARSIDYQDNGDLFAQTVDFDFDRLWLAIKSAFGWIRRALVLGPYDIDGQGSYRANNNRIQDLADPAAEQDAVNRRSMFAFVTDYVDKAIAGVVGGFGWFLQSGIGAVFRTFQGKMRDDIDLRDFLGDNWAGGDATEGIDKAVAAVAGTGRTLTVTDNYDYNGELVLSGKMTLLGRGGRIKFTVDNTKPSIRVVASKVRIRDLNVEVNLTNGLGSDGGANGTAVTVGRFFYDETPDEVRDVRIKGLRVTRTAGSWGGHVITVIGRVSDVKINDLETEQIAGAPKNGNAVLVHWGAEGPGPGLPFTGNSYHPNNVKVDGMTLDGHMRVYQISSSYDVTVKNVTGTNIDRVGDIIPGDEGNRYAPVEQKSFIGSNIQCTDFNVSGLINDSLASLRVYGLGFSRFDLTPGGQVAINWLQYRNVKMARMVLAGADDVDRVIDCQNASGSILAEDIDLRVGRLGIGARVLDGGRGVVFRNITARERIGFEIQNSADVTIDNCEHAVADRTGFVGDATSVLLLGRRPSTTLASGVVPGSANLSLTAALGQNLYPGSQIFVNGAPCRVRGVEMIRSTETTIPVEGVTVTATTGATVVADLSTRVVTADRISSIGADYTMLMSTAGGNTFYSSIKLLNAQTRRIEKSVVTLANCEHVDLCGNRFEDSTAVDVTVGAGSTSVTVERNMFGLNSTTAATLLSLSADSGNCIVRDNLFDKWVTAPISQGTQNSTRTNAGQYNQFSGNKSTSGALLDNGTPNSYYELYRNRVIRAAAAPTTGTWKNGDRCDYITPTAGGKVGAVCTVGGTPGTWKEFGAIDA